MNRSDDVVAGITYTVETGEKLVNETFGPGNVQRRTTGTYEVRPMSIRDARPLAGTLSVDTNGFVLAAHPTRVSDFFDAAQLQSVYYAEVENLV
jgi:hypothetical protein